MLCATTLQLIQLFCNIIRAPGKTNVHHLCALAVIFPPGGIGRGCSTELDQNTVSDFIFAETKKNFVKCTMPVPNGNSVLLDARRGSRHVLTTAWQPETTIAVKWLTNRLRPVHCMVLWQNGIIMYKRLSGHIIASLVTTRNWSAGQKLCKRALSFKKRNTTTRR